MIIEIESIWSCRNDVEISDDVEDIEEYINSHSEEILEQLDSGNGEITRWQWTGTIDT